MIETLKEALNKEELNKIGKLLKKAKKTNKGTDYEELKLYLVSLNNKFKKYGVDGANIAWSLYQGR